MFTYKSTRGVLKSLLAGSVAALMVAGPATSAMAAPTDRSEALGQFLGGDALRIDLDTLAAVRGALEQNPSGTPPVGPTANPLSAEVLGTLGVDLGNSLQLFGPNGILQLGAAAQYAEAADNGDAFAASGAVSDQGGVSLGGAGTPPADARISLTPVLGSVPAAAGVVSQLDVQLGALASTASQVQGAPVVSDYLIADARLNLTSPLVASTVSGTVNTLQTTVDSVEGLLETALGARLTVLGLATATADVDIAEPNLQALLPTAFTSTTTPGVTLNLQTGQVSVDVDAVLAANGVDINNLAPNTPLLSGTLGGYIGGAILTTLAEAVDRVESDLIATVRSVEVRGGVAVTVAGLPVNVALGGTLDDITVTTTGGTGIVLGLLNVDELANLAVNGVLGGVVEPALALVSTTLDGVAAGVPTAVVAPLLSVVESVVRIRANVQPLVGDLGAGSSTVRALDLTVLPATPLATVDLASSTVRGTAYVVPAPAPSIALAPSTVAAGASTTVTGSGFIPGESVTVGLPSVNGGPATSVTTPAAPNGTISVVLPVPAAYPVGAANVTARGALSDTPATAELTVTAPASDPAITLAPATVAVGGTTTVSGSGFAPGESVTVGLPAANGATPSVTTTATAQGTISVPLTVPVGYPVGPADVTALGVVSADPATAVLTITPAAYTPTITVDPTTVVAGNGVTVTGGGFAAGETVTVSIPAVAGGAPSTVDVIADADGDISAPLAIPADYPGGDVVVTALGAVSNTPATDGLTVVPAVVYEPAITLDPPTVVAGGSTTVTGEGFAADETVTVSIPGVNGGAPIQVEVSADADGTITATLPVPADHPVGPVDVTATGDVSDTPVTEELEVQAAAVIYTPEVALDPATVVPGGSTTVTGDGFAPGETVTVSIPGVDGGAPIQVGDTADGEGAIEVDITVPPTYPVGPVDVTVIGDISDTPVVEQLEVQAPAIVYTPGITAPGTVVAGDDIPVTGTGFAPGETVTVSIPGIAGGAPITVGVTADGEGDITATLPVPADYPAGDVVVTALGAVSDTPATDEVVVTYDTAITVPATAVAGDDVPVTGGGFAPGETVTVSIPGAADGDPRIALQVPASADGTITATLPVPANYPSGNVTVTALGEDSDTEATDGLKVVYETGISLNAPELTAGDRLVVTGDGFAPGENVVVSIPGVNEGDQRISVPVVADDEGTITAILPIPAEYPQRDVVVTALGQISNTPATAELTIDTEGEGDGTEPAIIVDPGTAAPGDTVVVIGDGFTPGETITVSLGCGGVATVRADGDGSFSVSMTVPQDCPAGTTTVRAEGDVSDRAATAQLVIQSSDPGNNGNGNGNGNGPGNGNGIGNGPGNGNGSNSYENHGGGYLASTGASGLFVLVGIALTVLVAGGAVLTSIRGRRS